MRRTAARAPSRLALAKSNETARGLRPSRGEAGSRGPKAARNASNSTKFARKSLKPLSLLGLRCAIIASAVSRSCQEANPAVRCAAQ
ncbi:hypothetical protein DM52_4945 [Burkholderia mallei]|nr:hypothetical protein DM52_4945 [Burkholderia mallei]